MLVRYATLSSGELIQISGSFSTLSMISSFESGALLTLHPSFLSFLSTASVGGGALVGGVLLDAKRRLDCYIHCAFGKQVDAVGQGDEAASVNLASGVDVGIPGS